MSEVEQEVQVQVQEQEPFGTILTSADVDRLYIDTDCGGDA